MKKILSFLSFSIICLMLCGKLEAQIILYEQLPLVTNPGAGAGGADASVFPAPSVFGYAHQLGLGNSVAEDFIVPSEGWYIDKFLFYAYQTGASSSAASTITGVYCQIWDGDPRDPSSSVVFGDLTTNRLLSSTWSGAYRVTSTTLTASNRPLMLNEVEVGITLPAGTYWVEWSSDGSLGSGPWVPSVSIDNMDTGNALQNIGGTWQEALNGTFTQAMVFAITTTLDFDATLVDASVNVCSDKYTEVVIQVRNNGREPISEVEVGYTLDAGEAVTETINATILPSETLEYTFTQTIDISDGNDYILDAFVSLPTDENTLNDAVIGTIVNNGSLGSGVFGVVLFSEDFEGGAGQECSFDTDHTVPGANLVGWLPSDWTVEVDAESAFSPTRVGPDWNWTYGSSISSCFAFRSPYAPVPERSRYLGIYESTGDNNEGEFLISPSYDFATLGIFAMQYSAFHIENIGDPDMGADVRISTDDGSTWTVLSDIPLSPDENTWMEDIEIDLTAYAGESNVKIAFYYTDGGSGYVTLAIDDVKFIGVPPNLANTTATTPLVEEEYVLQGTPHHVIYETTIVNPAEDFFILNDLVFKTNGSYRPSDINTQGDTLGFRLWWSADTILGPGDHFLGRVGALKSGTDLVFNCMSAPALEAKIDTLYLYLTADIAEDAVDNRTIWVEPITNESFGTILGTVTVSNAIRSERQIIGEPQEIVGDIFMANLFTPNGDGKNDNYTIIGGAITEEGFSFKIFDRNGALFYETNDLNEAINVGWDGKIDGEEAPNGLYLWSLEGNYLDGRELSYRQKKTGTVRLLR